MSNLNLTRITILGIGTNQYLTLRDHNTDGVVVLNDDDISVLCRVLKEEQFRRANLPTPPRRAKVTVRLHLMAELDDDSRDCDENNSGVTL